MRHSKRMLYSDKWSEEEGQTNHKEDLRKHPETPAGGWSVVARQMSGWEGASLCRGIKSYIPREPTWHESKWQRKVNSSHENTNGNSPKVALNTQRKDNHHFGIRAYRAQHLAVRIKESLPFLPRPQTHRQVISAHPDEDLHCRNSASPMVTFSWLEANQFKPPFCFPSHNHIVKSTRGLAKEKAHWWQVSSLTPGCSLRAAVPSEHTF